MARETADLRERVGGLETDLHRALDAREFDRRLRSSPIQEET